MVVYQIRELNGIGGENVYSMTKRLLEHVISDAVASKYSWCGQKGKKKFVLLNLKNALFGKLSNILWSMRFPQFD